MFPKVTTSLKEYLERTGRTEIERAPTTTGLYFDGVIWVAKPSLKTLSHEVGHHILGNSGDVKYISLRLFFDVLNTLWDVAHFRLTRKTVSKAQKQECITRLKEAISDWGNWVLCR
jgi:hypothetical protein